MSKKGTVNKDILKQKLASKMFSSFARRTWPNFVDGWFYEDLFGRLEKFHLDFLMNRRPCLKLSVPPRHGKSETVIRFCVYLMKMFNDIEIIYTTYSQQQAHRLSTKARLLAETLGLDPKGTKSEWALQGGRGALFRAVGRGGGLTGSGADLLVLDDMLKNSDEADSQLIRDNLWDFYTTTAETRLSPRGSQIAIGTRWHKDDFLGRLEEYKWPSIIYSALAITDEKHRRQGEALHPARFSQSMLAERRQKVSARWWSAIWQQQPILSETALIPQVRVVGLHEIPPSSSSSDFVSIDCSFKDGKSSDYNAIQRWRDAWPDAYCVDAINIKAGFSKLRDTLQFFIRETDHEILIEDKANGTAIIDSLRSIYPNIIPITPTESKHARLQAVSPMFEAGRVHFSKELSCLSEIEMQLTNFPVYAHDDQVDACSQALNRMRERNRDVFELGFVKPSWA